MPHARCTTCFGSGRWISYRASRVVERARDLATYTLITRHASFTARFRCMAAFTSSLCTLERFNYSMTPTDMASKCVTLRRVRMSVCENQYTKKLDTFVRILGHSSYMEKPAVESVFLRGGAGAPCAGSWRCSRESDT